MAPARQLCLSTASRTISGQKEEGAPEAFFVAVAFSEMTPMTRSAMRLRSWS